LPLALAVAAVVVLVDQLSKWWALSHVHQAHRVLGPLGLGLTFNTGSSFSLFAGHSTALTLVVPLLVVVLVVVAYRNRNRWVAVALGLVIGGALGNLSDRLFRSHHGAVVDFITLTHWPTFNVGDACIVVGLVLLVALVLWGGDGAARTTAGGQQGKDAPAGTGAETGTGERA
jgi:signal peptidase II